LKLEGLARFPQAAEAVRLDRATLRTSALGLGAFVVLAVVVNARLLFSVDLDATIAVQPLAGPALDLASWAVSVLLSAELSVVYALVLSWLLWRRGAGLWSVAPLAFVVPVGIETVLKTVVNQPWVPLTYYRDVHYPLATLSLQGTFPSGHALRGAWFCVFLAVLLRARRGIGRWLVPVACALVAILLGLTRIYLGDHWLSDVVGGLLLGGALALIAAQPVVSFLPVRD
jgi:membrane-associated phospholipid phosphatase